MISTNNGKTSGSNLHFTMRIAAFLLLALAFQSKAWAQLRSEYAIKEKYDYYDWKFVDIVEHPDYINTAQSTSDLEGEIGDTYGDAMCHVLESYLTMYETTGDKGYLLKFMDRTINVMEWRWDHVAALASVPNNFDKSWSIYMYQDGLTIWPMAHFVYLMNKVHMDLNDFQIPYSGLPSTHIANTTLGTWSTLGEFSGWLRDQVDLTLSHYVWGGYWDDNPNILWKKNPGDDNAQEINQVAGLTLAMYYIGQVDPNCWYRQRAKAIAERYWGINASPCAWPSFDPIFVELSNGSYDWRNNGWRSVDDCSSTDFEDISHATWTLLFPRAVANASVCGPALGCSECSESQVIFNADRMTRFHNTFTKNIFAGYSPCGDAPLISDPDFHSGVDGDDEITYPGGVSGFNALKDRALWYMWLQAYDDNDAGDKVYDILMNYYRCHLLDNWSSGGIDGPAEFEGLAETTKAQWTHECFNLELQNRELVYDQAFAAKGVLTVHPQSAWEGGPFADPKIPSLTFTVLSGIHSEFRAGQAVEFLPGFTAEAGSTVEAYIDPLGCDMQVIGFGGNGEYKNMAATGPSGASQAALGRATGSSPSALAADLKTGPTLTPNPTNSGSMLQWSQDAGWYTIEIADEFGRSLWERKGNASGSGQLQLELDVHGLPNGTYLSRISNSSGSHTLRLVVMK